MCSLEHSVTLYACQTV